MLLRIRPRVIGVRHRPNGSTGVGRGAELVSASSRTGLPVSKLEIEERRSETKACSRAVVVPGHLKPGTQLDASTVRHTRSWLTAFAAAVASAGHSGDVVNAMKQAFPEDGLALALEAGAKAAVPETK